MYSSEDTKREKIILHVGGSEGFSLKINNLIKNKLIRKGGRGKYVLTI